MELIIGLLIYLELTFYKLYQEPAYLLKLSEYYKMSSKKKQNKNSNSNSNGNSVSIITPSSVSTGRADLKAMYDKLIEFPAAVDESIFNVSADDIIKYNIIIILNNVL